MVSTSKKSFRPKRKFTKLNESVDSILNVLLDKDLIEIPSIFQHHFSNGVPKNYRFEEFCNCQRMIGNLTKNYKDLRNIIHDLIDQKAIQIDDTPKKEENDVGPIHPNNS